ncbi:ROK family protein [Virgibacillus sp. W0430]|uniref:ROK family protein n=1 Tax=Virgibacillus sp. W0430 TaxID=3391580 RepID=UPI003F448D97
MNNMKIAMIDIGGTSVKLGVANEKGVMEHQTEYATESYKGGEYILNTVIEKLKKIDGITGIGVCVPGQIDRKNGIIVNESANIPNSSGLSLKGTLEDYFQVPVQVENDVNAAALGESYFGLGKHVGDFIYLAYGTGIGGAIVYDSEIYYGRSGFAAEFGHMITHPFGYRCNCGLQGCYEKYASTTTLVQQAEKIDPQLTNGKTIMEKYMEGDERVQLLIKNWVSEIVLGIISIVHIFNPSTIILGGGIMEQERIVSMISDQVKASILESFLPINIHSASLGNTAGMYGALSLHLPPR